jgi:hypothetical protein
MAKKLIPLLFLILQLGMAVQGYNFGQERDFLIDFSLPALSNQNVSLYAEGVESTQTNETVNFVTLNRDWVVLDSNGVPTESVIATGHKISKWYLKGRNYTDSYNVSIDILAEGGGSNQTVDEIYLTDELSFEADARPRDWLMSPGEKLEVEVSTFRYDGSLYTHTADINLTIIKDPSSCSLFESNSTNSTYESCEQTRRDAIQDITGTGYHKESREQDLEGIASFRWFSENDLDAGMYLLVFHTMDQYGNIGLQHFVVELEEVKHIKLKLDPLPDFFLEERFDITGRVRSDGNRGLGNVLVIGMIGDTVVCRTQTFLDEGDFICSNVANLPLGETNLTISANLDPHPTVYFREDIEIKPVPPQPDLESDRSVERILVAGEPAEFVFDVVNKGNQNMTIFFDTEGIAKSWITLPDAMELAKGGTKEVTGSLLIPIGAESGNYIFNIIVLSDQGISTKTKVSGIVFEAFPYRSEAEKEIARAEHELEITRRKAEDAAAIIGEHGWDPSSGELLLQKAKDSLASRNYYDAYSSAKTAKEGFLKDRDGFDKKVEDELNKRNLEVKTLTTETIPILDDAEERWVNVYSLKEKNEIVSKMTKDIDTLIAEGEYSIAQDLISDASAFSMDLKKEAEDAKKEGDSFRLRLLLVFPVIFGVLAFGIGVSAIAYVKRPKYKVRKAVSKKRIPRDRVSKVKVKLEITNHTAEPFKKVKISDVVFDEMHLLEDFELDGKPVEPVKTPVKSGTELLFVIDEIPPKNKTGIVYSFWVEPKNKSALKLPDAIVNFNMGAEAVKVNTEKPEIKVG